MFGGKMVKTPHEALHRIFQGDSMLFARAFEKLLGVEMPERVKNIRVLIAELQRIASHLVWLGTHALEIGAVSVMMYCFREREHLLNINEMLAGFRMFPSYLRIGGLREDLPEGFHAAVGAFLDTFPGKLSEYEDLLTKNQIWLKRTRGVGVLSRQDVLDYGLVGPMARAAGVSYDVRKAVVYDQFDNTVTMTFTKVAINTGLPDNLFVFTAPKGTATVPLRPRWESGSMRAFSPPGSSVQWQMTTRSNTPCNTMAAATGGQGAGTAAAPASSMKRGMALTAARKA
jgi:hypothetical protein